MGCCYVSDAAYHQHSHFAGGCDGSHPLRARSLGREVAYILRQSRPFYRRSCVIRCSNGPQRADSEDSDDWDVAWEKFKEQRRDFDGSSGTDMSKSSKSTPEFEGKYPNLRDGRDVGPRFTKWGGNVRGGKYGLGEGADRILGFWGNGDAALYAAMAVIVLMLVLLQFPPPSAPL